MGWAAEEYDLDDGEFIAQMVDDGWDVDEIAAVMGVDPSELVDVVLDSASAAGMTTGEMYAELEAAGFDEDQIMDMLFEADE